MPTVFSTPISQPTVSVAAVAFHRNRTGSRTLFGYHHPADIRSNPIAYARSGDGARERLPRKQRKLKSGTTSFMVAMHVLAMWRCCHGSEPVGIVAFAVLYWATVLGVASACTGLWRPKL